MYKAPFWLILGRILSQVRERNKRERELEKEGWPVAAIRGGRWWPEVIGLVRFNLEPIIDATNAMNERIGITLAWTQTRKATGQEDARKQTRIQTLEVRACRLHEGLKPDMDKCI
ncbi:hypothetical protein HanXRQr2_Chr17g0801681 [Helianthus annuus]|nr:hypothetical protein HanXRQr2_Chr17g0801681 [Helianthus annuus]KAJ0813072.1 hypothetical protein HanPSC8_Chr17g0769281 [Helianthus annuus]